MSKSILHRHHAKTTSNNHNNNNNKANKKCVSWAEELGQWKEGEEETIQARKAAFNRKRRRSRGSRPRPRPRSPKEEAEWIIQKGEWMYSILTSEERGVREKIVEICNQDINVSMTRLQNVMLCFGLDLDVVVTSKQYIERALARTFGNAISQGTEEGDDNGRWHGWVKYVKEQQDNVDDGDVPLAAMSLSLLLECKPIKKHFMPVFFDPTTVASEDIKDQSNWNAATAMVSHVRPDLRETRLHYAQHVNPDNPVEALNDLAARWNENEPQDEDEDPPPINNVHSQPGNSATSSLTSQAMSPVRKKPKPSVPAGGAFPFTGKTTGDESDEPSTTTEKKFPARNNEKSSESVGTASPSASKKTGDDPSTMTSTKLSISTLEHKC